MANLTELRESTSDGTLPSYAWPGGYPFTYLTTDGLEVCPSCANQPDTSDPVVAGDVNWEGPATLCEDCGEVLESAYGDPNDPDWTHDSDPRLPGASEYVELD